MSTFLLEIGLEELPADFARLVLPQLEDLVRCDFLQHRLEHGLIQSHSTPRRIVLHVDEIAKAANDLEEERKGPPASQAYKDGLPTQAALGFAKRFNLDPSDLEIKDTSKGPFVFARVIERGISTPKLLAELIPQWIGGLQGRRFMRWGEGDKRFSRPIRWIVSLLDSELIPVRLEGSDPEILAGQYSRGHRLFSQNVFIPSADEYFSTLFEEGVQVDRKKRSSLIQTLIYKASEELGAKPDLSTDLFEELIDLVESPSLIQGSIEEIFLRLPAEVLSTVMRVHQRYIPLYRLDIEQDPLALDAIKILVPNFLCIGNGLPSARETIIRGNERVLRARLADAEFFIKSDLAVKSSKRIEKLDSVTFADGLGSLLDRVRRMEWLADKLLEQLSLSELSAGFARKATHFCKHDLVSQIIGEFPELQGVMGGKYLLAEGEDREVALAVSQHYLPRVSGDILPETDPGAVLALVERIELLLSIFAKGERPTGSSDPYALRRAANGVLQILWAKNWLLDLDLLLEKLTLHWSNIFPVFKVNQNILKQELSEFFRQRIFSLMEESGIDSDLAQSVAGETISINRLLSDPTDARLRAELLMNMRKSGELSAVQAVVTRAARLAQKGDLPRNILEAKGVVNSELFEKTSENEMLNVIESLEPIVKDSSVDRYIRLAKGLTSSFKTLEAFFDGNESVMVMVDDVEIRRNRLNLLGVLRNQAEILADFSLIKG